MANAGSVSSTSYRGCRRFFKGFPAAEKEPARNRALKALHKRGNTLDHVGAGIGIMQLVPLAPHVAVR